jgi:hypothetical protein
MRCSGQVAFFVVALAALPGFAWAQSAPLASTAGEPTLPDPVPGAGADLAPSAATAGKAYVGPPLRKADPALTCSPFNPCALPSSTPRKLRGLPLAP